MSFDRRHYRFLVLVCFLGMIGPSLAAKQVAHHSPAASRTDASPRSPSTTSNDHNLCVNRAGAGVTLGYDGNVDDYIFQTLYNNQYSWSGDVQATKLSEDGNTTRVVWSARGELPSPDDRQLMTWDASRGKGVAFDSRTLKDGDINTEYPLDDLVDYLRGDMSREQRKGGAFRDRLWTNGDQAAGLGDFIGSRPFLVGYPSTYHVPDEDDTSYTAFRAAHRERRPMLYVGGNDGMLHGFDAETGRETFGYIPGLVLEHLPELAAPDYEHRYYVDGSPTVLDARHGNSGAGEWFSLLASGLGAGGKGLFALDVTNPEKLTEKHADTIALWEYGPDDDLALFGQGGSRSQLGYIHGQPSIVRLENDRYAVIFGNGYFSDSGKASLYLLYVDGGGDGIWSPADVVRLTPNDPASNDHNGMTTVSLIDRDDNGRVDLAYGTDLQGDLWRFDLASSDTQEWSSHIHRLFTAERDRQRQVLTSPLAIGRHPDGGLMIFFGSGAEEKGGLPTSQERGTIDSFYAIRDDRNDTLRADTLTRASLSGRSLSSGQLMQDDSTMTSIRYLEGIRTDTYPGNGWYLDLGDGERVVDGPSLRGDRILFTSLVPGHGMCGAEDAGFLYEFNAWYGVPFATPVLDVNGDDAIDARDRYVAGNDGSRYVPVGIATEGAIFTPKVSIGDDGRQEAKVSESTRGKIVRIAEMPLERMRFGRVSWRTLE